MDTANRFARYLRFRSVLDDPFVELDLSHSALEESDVTALTPALTKALQAMQELEAGKQVVTILLLLNLVIMLQMQNFFMILAHRLILLLRYLIIT